MDSKVIVELSTTTSSSVIDFTQFTNTFFSAEEIKAWLVVLVNLIVFFVVATIVTDL